MSSLLLERLRKDSTVNNSYTNLTRNTFISYNSFRPYSPVPEHRLSRFIPEEPLHLQKLLNSLLPVTSLSTQRPATRLEKPEQPPPRRTVPLPLRTAPLCCLQARPALNFPCEDRSQPRLHSPRPAEGTRMRGTTQKEPEPERIQTSVQQSKELAAYLH